MKQAPQNTKFQQISEGVCELYEHLKFRPMCTVYDIIIM